MLIPRDKPRPQALRPCATPTKGVAIISPVEDVHLHCWPVVRLDFPGCICSPMEKRVPTIWGGRGLMTPGFARAVLRSDSSGSGLWLWPHMALVIDHVLVMQRVAGPEA